jgi:hypothetical protein
MTMLFLKKFADFSNENSSLAFTEGLAAGEIV